jgi:hypothetical protein
LHRPRVLNRVLHGTTWQRKSSRRPGDVPTRARENRDPTGR